MVELHLKLFN